MSQTLHLPTLPHVRLSDPKHSFCAYGRKSAVLPALLRDSSVMTYAPPGSKVFRHEADGVHGLTGRGVHAVKQSDLMQREIGQPEWDQGFFGQWDPNSPLWKDWNARCIAAIREHYSPGDVIGLIAGWCQREIKDAFPDAQCWEWGVGYRGVMPDTWATFESNHWLSAIRGALAAWKSTDSVVPNCYYADEFDQPREHEGYLLYLGRIVEDKGMSIVREIGRVSPNIRIIAAGQGDPALLPPNAEHVGVVSGAEKRKLLSGAMALLAPTIYLEPFGGVAIEAAMSGVPPITTAWGVFPETIGGRLGLPELQCTTLDDFMDAIELARSWTLFERVGLAERAEAHFGDGHGYRRYRDVLAYIEAVARGESAWYGSWASWVNQ